VDPDIGRLVDIQDYPGKILPGIYWIQFGNIKLTRTMHATEMCSLCLFCVLRNWEAGTITRHAENVFAMLKLFCAVDCLLTFVS
jgi:hypothetical protein